MHKDAWLAFASLLGPGRRLEAFRESGSGCSQGRLSGETFFRGGKNKARPKLLVLAEHRVDFDKVRIVELESNILKVLLDATESR